MNDNALKLLLIAVNAMNAPATEMSPRAKAVIDAALAKLQISQDK